MANLDSSIASVALPTIGTAFHVPLAVVQWVVTAYLLTVCALLPIAGKISDLYGKGRLYNVGFFIFAAGSALSALSVSVSMLIGAKVFQALGASLVMANTQGIIADTFGPEERGRALGITGISVSLGSLSGPALGGFFIDHFGWPSIFWINVPIALLGFGAGLRIMPKERPERSREPFDYAGSALFVLGMTALLYTVSGAESRGWTSWPTVGGLLGAAVVLGLFYVRETRTSYPMLDFSLYRIKLFLTGSVAAYLSVVALFCVTIMMPFFLQYVLRCSPEVTGYVMAAYPLAMAVTAPLAGWMSDRIGPFVLTTGGLVLNALGFVALNFLPSDGVSLWVVAGNLAIFGIGHGMFQPSNNSDILGAVPRAKVGLAGGLNALTRNFGMMSGVSVSVSLFTYRLQVLSGESGSIDLGSVPTGIFMSALHTVFWVAAVVCAVAAAVSSMRGKSGMAKPQLPVAGR